MKRHTTIDNLVASMGAMYGNALKFFSNGVDSPPVRDLVSEMHCSQPLLDGSGEYTVTVRTGDGQTEVPFFVERWRGKDAPTLVFHHGSGDIPYRRRLEKILRAHTDRNGALDAANIIATCSPYNGSKREYFTAIRDLRSFGESLAGSVVLVEAIRQSLPAASPFVVAGISLGGWITNLHHTCFDTADEYRPIFAGAALDALFTESAYSTLTADRALARPEALHACLNFEADFRRRSNGNVYPLMARHDQYIMFDSQSTIYRPENISVIEKGHVTGSADNRALLAHLAALADND